MNQRRLRRSQTLTPFGVGAIFDIVGESFVAEDIHQWRGRAATVSAPRIAAMMGVERLRTAPPAPERRGSDGPGVPFYRFPQWLFCPDKRCRRMVRWSTTLERQLDPGSPPRCSHCRSRLQLVPMRFVMICGNGHLDDVDWRRWAHSDTRDPRQQNCRVTDALVFEVASDRGGGLESLRVRCLSCKAMRSLDRIASPETPKSLGWSCRGRQPWQRRGIGEECDASPVIVQRGASNVHFPAMASALDIPPDSNYDHESSESVRIRAHPNFARLLENPEHPMRDSMIDLICFDEDVDSPTVEQALSVELDEGQAHASTPGVEYSEEQIRRDEWTAFLATPTREGHPRDNFVVEHVDLTNRARAAAQGAAAEQVVDRIQTVAKARRLREIRVLRGFRRYTLDKLVPADLGQRLNWLPAIEVFGEGVFVALDEQSVQEWESKAAVQQRIRKLAERRDHSFFGTFLPEVTARFVMIHTLAHLLIRQLVYESGYSSSSIRERLFVTEPLSGTPMAGLLVYTGAGDAEGTLGGLVRAGEPDWFIPTMIAALRRAEWCSLDPVCRESSGQGPDALSLAACHACALASETSCEHHNCLLDRALLIDPDIGYLAGVIAAAATESAQRVI